MKKLKLFSGLILAMISVLIVGCSKDSGGNSSSFGPSSDPSSSPIGDTSSGGQTPNRNALEEALMIKQMQRFMLNKFILYMKVANYLKNTPMN